MGWPLGDTAQEMIFPHGMGTVTHDPLGALNEISINRHVLRVETPRLQVAWRIEHPKFRVSPQCTFGDTVQRALSGRKLVLAWFHQAVWPAALPGSVGKGW